MKHTVIKGYRDFEKEEKWLNEMCAKGLHMVNYTWMKYTFDEGESGEYIYRIELLENLPTHPESVAYIRFLEENGIEHVCSYMRWIYLRKKTSDGPFDVYTDIESKIKHYKRVAVFWLTLMTAELLIGVSNVGIGISVMTQGMGTVGRMNLVLGSVCILLGLLMFFVSRPQRKKIKKLKKDAEVHQ